MGMSCKGTCKPVRAPVCREFLTWEFHVSEPSKPANPPSLYGHMGIPCTQGPESAHLHGILRQFRKILQQAFPTWKSHVDLVTFHNLHTFSMWEGFFLWPFIWVSHVKTIKSIERAQNMRIPCKTVTKAQQHGNPMLFARAWAHQHTIAM